MLVTVSGPPGSGTSSAAAALAEAMEIEHVSGGDIFRELAAERGMTVAEFGELAESDDSIDRNLDHRLRQIAIERDDVILESRLAGWMAGEFADVRLWLDAPLSVRAERIAERETCEPSTAKEQTITREASEERRYAKYYDIDIGDRRIYDLVVNTARWDLETEIEILLRAIDTVESDGAVPIDGIRYDFE